MGGQLLGWAVTQSGSETELDLERQRSWKVPLGSTLGPCEEPAGLSSEDLHLPVPSSPSSSPSPPPSSSDLPGNPPAGGPKVSPDPVRPDPPRPPPSPPLRLVLLLCSGLRSHFPGRPSPPSPVKPRPSPQHLDPCVPRQQTAQGRALMPCWAWPGTPSPLSACSNPPEGSSQAPGRGRRRQGSQSPLG